MSCREVRLREHWQGALSDADFVGPNRRARPGERFDLARLCVPLFYTRLDIQWRVEVGDGVVGAVLDAEESGRVGQRVQHVLPPNTVPTCRLEIYDANLLSAFDAASDRFSLNREQTIYARRLVLGALQRLSIVSATAPVALASRLEHFLPEQLHPHWTSRDTVACNYGIQPGDCDSNRLLQVRMYRDRPSWVIDRDALRRWEAITGSWPSDGTCDLLLDYFSMATIDLARDHRKAFVSWAIMFELMFGAGIRNKLSERMSRRAANLSIDPDHGAYDQARSWYRIRSRLLHEGLEPTAAETIEFGVYMKRTFAAYMAARSITADVRSLHSSLDEAPLVHSMAEFEPRVRHWLEMLHI